MERNWKIIMLLLFVLVIILLVVNLWKTSGTIRDAVNKLSESQKMLDKATASIQSSQEIVATLQSNISDYAAQVRHADSLVSEIEQNRVRRENEFLRKIGSAQASYNDLKNKIEGSKRRDWPVVSIDTLP
jgi:predicted  nucleic acid-binding Zn-ribbon protein